LSQQAIWFQLAGIGDAMSTADGLDLATISLFKMDVLAYGRSASRPRMGSIQA
jgi:hypothetical protein